VEKGNSYVSEGLHSRRGNALHLGGCLEKGGNCERKEKEHRPKREEASNKKSGGSLRVERFLSEKDPTLSDALENMLRKPRYQLPK